MSASTSSETPSTVFRIADHEREAQVQLIHTARAMASMLRDNDPHAARLINWAQMAEDMMERYDVAVPR